MAKILVSGIFIFISLGFLIIGGLVIQNNLNMVDSSNYGVDTIGFNQDFTEFKLDVFVTFGKLSVTEIRTNLDGWNQIDGLFQEKGANQHLIVTLGKGSSGDEINQNSDFSELWIHFYLSDNRIIKWSDNTYSIE